MEIVLALTTTLTLLNTLLILYLRHHISDLRDILHELDITYWKEITSLKIDLNKKIHNIDKDKNKGIIYRKKGKDNGKMYSI